MTRPPAALFETVSPWLARRPGAGRDDENGLSGASRLPRFAVESHRDGRNEVFQRFPVLKLQVRASPILRWRDSPAAGDSGATRTNRRAPQIDELPAQDSFTSATLSW